jgi:hypothetical protein
MGRLAGIVLMASGLTAVATAPARAQVPAPAQVQVDDAPRDHLLAVGAKAGIVPPILAVAEVIARPTPKLAAGVFGMYTSGSGLGNGAARISLGAELVVEFRQGRQNTPYLSFAYDYYHASPDANRNWETSQTAYVTAGYVLKSSRVEFYFGGGLIFFLSDEVSPCSGFCLNSSPPPLFPTLELGVRFAFL